jgi:hypothetical protein
VAFPEESTVSHTFGLNHALTRREFTRESLLAMLAGVTITITGCSDDDNPTGPTPSGGSDFSGTISANHGHVATVTGAQVTAAGQASLDIMGTATHPHTVVLTASQVQQIGSRQQVSVTSTTDAGHNHTVTFN